MNGTPELAKRTVGDKQITTQERVQRHTGIRALARAAGPRMRVYAPCAFRATNSIRVDRGVDYLER